MKRIGVIAVGVLTALMMVSGPALAQHPSAGFPNEPLVEEHQHFINGQRVGPNACAQGMSRGFDHFHINVHLGKPGLGVFRDTGGAGLLLVDAQDC